MYYVSAQDSVRQFDRFKTIALMLMVLLLVPVLWLGRVTTPEEQPGDTTSGEAGLTMPVEPTAPAQSGSTPMASEPELVLDTPQDGTTSTGDSATVAGKARPGERVEVLVNGASVGQVNVTDDGQWRYDIALPQPGDYRITARTLAADSTEQASAGPVMISRLPTLMPVATPAIVTPAADAAVAVGEVNFDGTGEPLREVVLVVDGKELGRGSIGQDGKWSLAATLDAADHDVHAYTLDDAGNALMSNSVHVTASGTAGPTDAAASTQTAPATGNAAPPAADDADKDSVADAADKCPGTPEGVKVDASGCPLRGETLLTLTGVKFDNNQATIRPDSLPVLDAAIEVLRQNASVHISIEGHTDDRGDEAYNLFLSQQRAESVQQYLIDHGIDAERLEALGRGESQPRVSNDNDTDRIKNRRVEFIVK